ncbi:MAG: CrcB family protein [Bacteriovoracaceae bacterium]|nr:CrcB family protein [Bacteriovoracaceae bacterium]
MATFTFSHLLIVFSGGGIGATLRWGLSGLVSSMSGRPWTGTLFVNLIGCAIFFLISKTFSDIGKNYDLLFKTGILGSLTTFSTFAFDVVSLFKQGMIKEAAMALGLNVIFGIIIGIWILR